MNKYPKYKNSQIEYTGDVPEIWQHASLKFLVTDKITDGPHTTPEFLDEGVPFVSAEGVTENGIDFNKIRGFISNETHLEYSKKCKPQKGDVFIVKSGSTTGKSTIVQTDMEFNIWSPICIVRANQNKVISQFVHYSIKADYFRKSIELGWSFGTQPNIGMGVIENLRITFPPLPEQKAIVAFLDEKTELIDDLISKTERKIELIKEKRTALINETVTKGLNPNAPMRDSMKTPKI